MTTNTVSVVTETRYDEIAMTFTKSQLIVQHSMSCIFAKMMTVPELMAKLVMSVSESSVRESVDELSNLGYIHKLEIGEKHLIGLTPKGSYISPAVKKILFSQQALF